MIRFKEAVFKSRQPKAWDLVHDRRIDGRSRPIRVGRYSPDYGEPPLSLLAKLNDAERVQVAAWWAARVADYSQARLNKAVDEEIAPARRLLTALRKGTVLPEKGPEIWQLVDDLTAALREARMARPKKAVVVAPAAPLEPTPLEVLVQRSMDALRAL